MRSEWLRVISRITSRRCKDIDFLLKLSPPNQCGRDLALWEREFPESGRAISGKFWNTDAPASTHIGVRVLDGDFNVADVALQLGAVAIERGVVPVIFSYVPWSGFEQYGFRVEKIHTPAQLASKDFEAELCAFWNISFVIDVSDVRTLV